MHKTYVCSSMPRIITNLLALVCFSWLTKASTAEGSEESFQGASLRSFCDESGEFGEFAGVAGIPIRFVKIDTTSSLGALVILNGRTETFLKYCELAREWQNLGFAIYMMDHRGQGLSGRLLEDRQKGHLVHFNDFVSDVKTFVDDIVAPNHNNIYALGHSVGGAVVRRSTLNNTMTLMPLCSLLPCTKSIQVHSPSSWRLGSPNF